MDMEITCPSGLRGVVRGLKVRDEEIVYDAKLYRSGALFAELAKRCWVSTIDPGPYDFANGTCDWEKALQSDSYFLFLQIRAASYGKDYTFTLPCVACRSSIEWTQDITSFQLKSLPAASVEHVKTDRPLCTTLEDGRKVWFRLLRGADNRVIAQLQSTRKLSGLAAALVCRIVAVEDAAMPQLAPGASSGPGVVHRGKVVQFVEDLDASDATRLREVFEEADCGVETRFSVTCNACFYEQATILPFGQDFWAKKARPTTLSETGSVP